MFFANLFVFIIAFFFISVSLSGHGKLITYKNNLDFFENIFFGFIFLALINTFIHFFVEIKFQYSFSFFLVGLIFFFRKNLFKQKLITKKNILFFLLLIVLVPIFISQKYHEDFGYYHLPYSLLLLEEKIIFGIANSNIAYVYNSIWLNIYPSFFLWDKSYDYLTFSTFILYVIFISYLINNIVKNERWKLSKLFSILLIFYYVLKFSRISEFGVDLPSAVYSNLSILFFIKFFETDNPYHKKNLFFLNLNFAVFSILIKLSSFPVILLSIILLFKNFELLKKELIKINFIFIYLLSLFFLFQQFIYTGCIIFPNELSCLNVSWFNHDFLSLKTILETINKSYSEAKEIMSKEEFLKNFNWFSYWFKRNYSEIGTHILTMLLPMIIIYFFTKKKNGKNFSLNEIRLYLLIFVLVSLIFWLTFSPVYRFAIPFFITAVFLTVSIFFNKREISNNLFVIFIILCLTFNFTKNVNRIYEKKKIFFGIDKIVNKYILDKENSKNHTNIYFVDYDNNRLNGWQGRLCWDVPVLCTNIKIQVKRNNNYLFISKLLDE
jgi:hypothetical protein